MEANEIKGQKIIVDSCILLYCEANVFKQEIRSILRTLADNDNELSISTLSIFEVLKNCAEKYKNYFLKLLKYLINIEIDSNTLLNSVVLHKAYQNCSVKDFQKISEGDYMVGGTVLTFQGALLLTANRKDFPDPLWQIVGHNFIAYKLGEKHEIINIYFLVPNSEAIEKYAGK